MGKATYSYGYAAINSTSVYVTLPLGNVGDDCVLHLHAVIGVASAAGPFQAAMVEDNGTESATGGSLAQSASIRSGGSLNIVLGAWWEVAILQPENGTPFPAPPCLNPTSDVTRVEFPLATGTIQIKLPTVFKQVCSSPASVSLTIKSG